jgi:hypothetical protein
MRPFLLLALLFLASFSSFAKEKVTISPEPLWLFKVNPDLNRSIDPKNVNNGYYLELLDQQVNIINQTEYSHFQRNIINESGIQNASEISVVYTPEYQQVIIHYVKVIRNGVELNRLNLKEIKIVQEETDAEDFQYNGTKRAFITLKDIRKGDRIEAAYSIQGFNPVFGNHFQTHIYFSNNNPITNYFETIICEPERKLYLNYFQDASKPSEEIVSGAKVYHWNNPVVKIWESQKGVPSWYNSYPYVAISEYKEWNEVVDWGVSLFNDYNFELPAALKTLIEEWKKKANGNDEEFARQAVRYVQDNIRYLGMEIGINTHKPHDPAKIFTQGYGDCKDKSLLLVTILRAGNMPAYVALLNTGKKSEMAKAEVAPSIFNHAIVAVQRPDGFQFIDPTMTYQRGKFTDIYLPDYAYALVLRKGETGLTKIPHNKRTTTIVENLIVAKNDTSRLKVVSTFTGGAADNIRGVFAGTSMKDMKDSYTEYYDGQYDGIAADEDIIMEDDSVNNTIVLKESYIIPEIWTVEKGKPKMTFSVYAKTIQDQFSEPVSISKKLPMALNFPQSLDYTLKMEMFEDWSFPRKPIYIFNDSYEFEYVAKISGKFVTLKYTLKTFKDHIPGEETAQYKEDYKKISDCFGYELSYTDIPKGTITTGFNPNKWTIILSVFIAGAFAFLFTKLNKRTVEVPYDRDSGWNIGGWMVLLGIGLSVGVMVHAISLFSAQYFNQDAWNSWTQIGAGFHTTVVCELIFALLNLFSSLAVLYWFLMRRDIFPQMFISYVLLMFSGQLIMLVIYSNNVYPESVGNLASKNVKELVRLMVYGAIWCTYVIRSYRAKATFLK